MKAERLIFVIMVLTFILLFLAIWFGISHGQDYLELEPWQFQCIDERQKLRLVMNPAYGWGGISCPLDRPADCSGTWIGDCWACGVHNKKTMKSPKRETSYGIANQRGGWNFPYTSFEQAKKFAIMSITVTEDRIGGHMGTARTDFKNGKIKIAHASSRLGYIESECDINNPRKNYWYTHRYRILQVDWKSP